MTRHDPEPPWQVSLEAELDAFVLPPGATADWAVRSFGIGVVDPKSMTGLSKLRRLRPRDWHLLVWRLTRVHALTGRSTVSGLLTSDAFSDQGMPRRRHDFGRLKRYRASARRLDARVGGVPARKVDERLLEQLGADWSSGPDALAAETVRRDLALLRRLVARWAVTGGQVPRVLERPRGPLRRQGRRAPRATPEPTTVLMMLDVLGSEHRVAAAMAAGAGLAESEILRLRVRDIDLGRRRVVVRTGRTRGRPGLRVLRREPVAGWAINLLVAEMGWLPGADARQLLFPNRRDPSRPRSDLSRGFAAASRRALAPGSDPVTLGSLRRLWQSVLRQGGVARTAIRQSYSLTLVPRGSGALPWVARQRRLLASWTHLLAPPGLPGPVPRVPRKGPRGCGAYDPERPGAKGGADKGRPLPESCGEDLPGPVTTRRLARPIDRETTDPAPPSMLPEPMYRQPGQGQAGGRTNSEAAPSSDPPSGLDEAAVRRVVRSEVEAALTPLLQSMERVVAANDRASEGAFMASAAGSVSAWALTNPEQAQEWISRLGEFLGQDFELPSLE